MGQLLQDPGLYNAGKKYSLRQVILEDFKIDLPIKGGWGYSTADAVVINKNDETVKPGLPFDGIGIERIVVEKRIYEELIIFRQIGEKFAGIHWELIKQSTFAEGDKQYDHLIFKVTGHSDENWENLKREYKENADNEDFDFNAHFDKEEQLKYEYIAEYYFEITSFY